MEHVRLHQSPSRWMRRHLYVLGGVSAPREAVRWSRASEWQALLGFESYVES